MQFTWLTLNGRNYQATPRSTLRRHVFFSPYSSPVSLTANKAEELSHVYQLIGFQCFKETLFEEAGKNLLKGDIDPRLLISYYPDLCGSLFAADDIIEVFSGVADEMPMDNSVDNISESFFLVFPALPDSSPFCFVSSWSHLLCLLDTIPYFSRRRALTFLSWN
jgi:hypothetical protein